jgi:hypothetical protein
MDARGHELAHWSIERHRSDGCADVCAGVREALLAEESRLLSSSVPPVTVNPENYVMECRGPLHIARYEKGHLFSIFESCGFEVERFDHGTELDRQSGVYLRAYPARPR